MSNKVLSFFAGAGGFDRGFLNQGFEIVGAYEWDKFAVQSYRANIGDHVEQIDVSLLKGSHLTYADVWLFGFPCQDLSVQGRRAGLMDGKKSSMFFQIMRLLTEVQQRPRIIVAENVKGLNPYLPVVEEEFNKVGYDFHVIKVNTKDFCLPQSRERFLIVGTDKSSDKQFQFTRSSSSYTPFPMSIENYLDEKVDERFFYPDTEEDLDDLIRAYYQKDIGINELGELGYLPSINGHDILKRVYHPKGICPTLTTCPGGNTQAKILLQEPDGRWRVRKLTPSEYAKLQGFENFVQVVSNYQMYRQMGNAVSVPVAEAIAADIKEFLS